MDQARKTGQLYVIVGVVLAFVTVILLLVILSNAGGSAAGEGFVPVVALMTVENASANVLASDLLSTGRVAPVIVDPGALPEGSLVVTGAEAVEGESISGEVFWALLQGAATITEIPAGSYLRASDLTWAPGLPLPEGLLAMAIPVDAVQSLAGMVQPGDRVDVLAAFSIRQQDELGETSVALAWAEVILQDVVVLDVRGSRSESGSLAQVARGVTSDEEAGLPRDTGFEPIDLVVIVAVDLQQAVRLHYALVYSDGLTLAERAAALPVDASPPVADDTQFGP
jgi:pilus assembly protein CpaB